MFTSAYLFKVKNKEVVIDSLFIKFPDLPIIESFYCFEEDSVLFGTKNGVFIYDGKPIMAQEALSFSFTNSPLYFSFASWVLGV